MYLWLWRQPLTLSPTDTCGALRTPQPMRAPDTPQKRVPAPHAARTASETSHIWSHGIRCGPASSSGLGSLTKMSPLQVTDQMAWWEGGPWIRLLSQQDMFSRDSYEARRREPKASLYSENKHFHRCFSITKPLQVLAKQESELVAFSQRHWNSVFLNY